MIDWVTITVIVVMATLGLGLAMYYGYLMGRESGADDARKQLNEQKAPYKIDR